ncbi:hypothetical protein IWZ01DRAFT_485319 [Phyllosticta capitalensis]
MKGEENMPEDVDGARTQPSNAAVSPEGAKQEGAASIVPALCIPCTPNKNLASSHDRSSNLDTQHGRILPALILPITPSFHRRSMDGFTNQGCLLPTTKVSSTTLGRRREKGDRFQSHRTTKSIDPMPAVAQSAVGTFRTQRPNAKARGQQQDTSLMRTQTLPSRPPSQIRCITRAPIETHLSHLLSNPRTYLVTRQLLSRSQARSQTLVHSHNILLGFDEDPIMKDRGKATPCINSASCAQSKRAVGLCQKLKQRMDRFPETVPIWSDVRKIPQLEEFELLSQQRAKQEQGVEKEMMRMKV